MSHRSHSSTSVREHGEASGLDRRQVEEAAFQVTFVKVVHHRHDLRVHAELHIEACADGFVRHLNAI